MILPQTFLVFSFEWGGPFLTTWHIGSSSNFPISVAHKMLKPKPALHPNEFSRICYVRPIFRLCYVFLKKIVCKECLLPAAASAADALCHFPKYSASKENEKNCQENHEFQTSGKRTNVSRLTNCLSLVSDMLVMFNTTSGKKHSLKYQMNFFLLGHTLLV